jgi:carbon-monoxide dehydrogenase medium subunit
MALSGSRWVRPSSVAEAAGLAAAGATLFGGGALLMSSVFAAVPGTVVVDLDALHLDGLDVPEVGAQVRLEDLLASAAVKQGWPAIWAAAAQIASPNVRRLASVGGTVAAALPGSDLLTALCASGAQVRLTCADGTGCTLSVLGYLTARQPGVITGLHLGHRAPGAYRRLGGRPVPAPAVVTVAAVEHDDDVEVWVGGIGRVPQPLRTRGRFQDVDCAGDAAWPAVYRRRVMDALCADLLTSLADPA